MAEEEPPPEFVEDVSQNPALALVDAKVEAGEITPAVQELFKGKYQELHALVLASRERQEAAIRDSKKLQQDVLGEKIKLEKQSIRKAEEHVVVSNLEKEKDKALRELEECNERDQFLNFEIQQLSSEAGDLKRQLSAMSQENADLVEPLLAEVREAIAEQQGLLARSSAEERQVVQRKADYEARTAKLRADFGELQERLVSAKQMLMKIKSDPDRIKKNAEVVTKAVENYASDVARLEQRVRDHDGELVLQARKRKEAEDVGKDLGRKLDLHRETIEGRQRDVETVRKNLKLEQDRAHVQVLRKAELEKEQKAADDDMKSELERLALAKADFEKQKKAVKKRRAVVDSLAATIPMLRLQGGDARAQVVLFQNEAAALRAKLADVKAERDVFVAKFLVLEVEGEEKVADLRGMMGVTGQQESDIMLWTAEEHKANKTVAMLTAQREVKAREAAKAAANEKETQESLKIKELLILDLTKKCGETNNRLKEFSALYDVVKNERNKYVNLIQASSQALAEMKEKIKILQNEVEILRNESLAKDKGLGKESGAHHVAQVARDQLRLETNKCQATYRQKQELVEQQIVEIDKLNSIINGMEKDMRSLKDRYEQLVEARNFTGVQLIDRNDELCILYEKANIQEQTLKKGTIAIQQREDETRMLHLQLAESQRAIEATRKQMPNMPQCAEAILQLQQELAMEREMTEMLCRDLETPNNMDRWRELGGEDPDMDQLGAKRAVIEERLNDKKEQLLEKELVLEEVTSLSDKLRQQAAKGRGETLSLAKKVNDFQSRIKTTTRTMMATVSELSMYQATAMKLQQEKHDREVELEDAHWHMEHGEPPSDVAEQEWYRLQRERLRRREETLERAAQQEAGAAAPSQVTRTTAEPRPNAYIPDELGIPKPYGALAPFKPTEPGTTMRHIRNPVPKEIEI